MRLGELAASRSEEYAAAHPEEIERRRFSGYVDAAVEELVDGAPVRQETGRLTLEVPYGDLRVLRILGDSRQAGCGRCLHRP